MNETQIEKKAQREADRLDQYQQKKRAEELANGTALEQLTTKSKKKRSLLSLQKLKVKKLLHGLPNVLNRNKSIPYVLCAILYPSHFKLPRLSMKKQENRDIRDSNVQQLCAVIREERAEELARVGLGNNAARKSHSMDILKRALAK